MDEKLLSSYKHVSVKELISRNDRYDDVTIT